MKKIIAITAASVLSASPAFAGVYAEVETNVDWSNGSYEDTLLETHLGYEADLSDDTSWYIQGGPAWGFVADGENVELATGKVGVKHQVTDNLTAYGELSAATADDYEFEEIDLGVKAGLTYSF